MIRRRAFLEASGLLVASHWYPISSMALGASPLRDGNVAHSREIKTDLLILGAGLGGCAAALGALRAGKKVILTEPTAWIGGQLTSQAVPPDEHPWIESKGAPPSYRKFRQKVREYYVRNYPLTDSARKNPALNPGNGSVSRLCHEPRVALAVLDEMLAEYLSTGQLTLFLHTVPISAEWDRDRIRIVTIRSKEGLERGIAAKLFIDASEQGDLLPLVNAEYVVGAESQKDTEEPHAPEKANPKNIQSFAHCFAMDHLDDEDCTIDKPSQYSFWRDHIPPLTPAWSGKLLSLSYSNPRTLEPKELAFIPPSRGNAPPKTSSLNLWLYRRIVDPSLFTSQAFGNGVTIVNWPQNDYMLGNLIDEPEAELAKHAEAGRQLSLSLFYWLQTEAPRPDGGNGWKGLRLRGDLTGTEDGLAMAPYIRESRRIEAEFRIVEQHLSKKYRSDLAKQKDQPPQAERFFDSVGIGYYHLDLHPSSGGDNYIDFESLPFQIPLGALIPKRIENLIAGCKNIGTTHISNGCYRLHPVEWSIGEAAGTLAAMCLDRNESPRGIRNRAESLKDLQKRLVDHGIELEWT